MLPILNLLSVDSYLMCCFTSGFFRSTSGFYTSSLGQVSVVLSFLLLSGVALCEFTLGCLSVLLWVDTWSVSSSEVAVSIAAVNMLACVFW